MARSTAKTKTAARNKNGSARAGARKKNGAARATPPLASYDAFKEYKGKRYTGMKVGRGHKWKYDAGEWTEKKVTPDKWEFSYSVTKRRSGKAPEGSGVPVGTAYHWYIFADQCVQKLDANNYSTEMVGIKYKLAHKRVDKSSWSASETAQRRRLIQLLKEMISELQKAPGETTAPAAAAHRSARTTSKKKATPERVLRDAA
jgi:hypothetical protein